MGRAWHAPRAPASHRPEDPTSADPAYWIDGQRLAHDSPGLQAALAAVHGTETRPRCLCVPEGVDMYVALHAQFVVKRMPGTGPAHHPACPSYEPPPSATGLGDLLGDAIVERGLERVEVRLGFRLAQALGTRAPAAPPLAGPSVTATPRRLSMRGLLHLLWDRAGFARWSPRMAGKRPWGVLRRYLLEAAGEIEVRGQPLASRLFLPEPFQAEVAAGLRERRDAFFAALAQGTGADEVPLALLLAEVKDWVERPAGAQVTLKHLPDETLRLDPGTARQVTRRFEAALMAKAQQPDTRLVLACTLRAGAQGLGSPDTLALMATTAEWLPFEDLFERALLAALVREARRFVKPLPYEGLGAAPLASALLLDTGDVPVPLRILAPLHSRGAAAGRGADGWTWRPGEQLRLPPLPPPAAAR